MSVFLNRRTKCLGGRGGEQLISLISRIRTRHPLSSRCTPEHTQHLIFSFILILRDALLGIVTLYPWHLT
jgi:hypothetical protein